MSTIQLLKKRIKGVKSVQKVTSAMEMVSMIRYKKNLLKLNASRQYFQKLNTIAANLLMQFGNYSAQFPEFFHQETEKNKKEKILIVIFTSDRGLCGGFNSSLINAVLKKIKALQNENYEVSIASIGRRGTSLLNSKKTPLLFKFSFDNLFSDVEKTGVVLKELKNYYFQGNFSKIIFFYNSFKSIGEQKPQMSTFLPLEIETAEGLDKQYIIEPTRQEVFQEILNQLVNISFKNILLESYLSENASRQQAMRQATDNADDMLSQLNLAYNKMRQAKITQEISEIVRTAEALG